MEKETSRPKTGEYRVNFYDKYGSLMKDLRQSSPTYTGALALGWNWCVDTNELLRDLYSGIRPVSFSVDRRLFNSLDTKIEVYPAKEAARERADALSKPFKELPEVLSNQPTTKDWAETFREISNKLRIIAEGTEKNSEFDSIRAKFEAFAEDQVKMDADPEDFKKTVLKPSFCDAELKLRELAKAAKSVNHLTAQGKAERKPLQNNVESLTQDLKGLQELHNRITKAICGLSFLAYGMSALILIQFLTFFLILPQVK